MLEDKKVFFHHLAFENFDHRGHPEFGKKGRTTLSNQSIKDGDANVERQGLLLNVKMDISGNGAVEDSFETRTAQMSALF